MALAAPKPVITQVLCAGLTPRSPAIAEIDTLASALSRIVMNEAVDSAIVPNTSWLPDRGGGESWR